MPSARRYKFMVMRRISQVSIMFLFFAGNIFGWHVLRGNLSASRLFDSVPLSDPFALIQIFAAGGKVTFDVILGALVVTLFFGVVAGRAFCSWVCPLNIVTDTANWLNGKCKIGTIVKNHTAGRKARYWVIGISLVVSAVSGIAAFEWISPVSMLHRGIVFGMGIGWTSVLGVFLFDLFVAKNGFCGHFCPLGGFYSVISRFSIVKVRHNMERCTSCMKCLEICPEKQVLPMVGKSNGMVASGECTNCARCIEVCNEAAMTFGIKHRQS